MSDSLFLSLVKGILMPLTQIESIFSVDQICRDLQHEEEAGYFVFSFENWMKICSLVWWIFRRQLIVYHIKNLWSIIRAFKKLQKLLYFREMRLLPLPPLPLKSPMILMRFLHLLSQNYAINLKFFLQILCVSLLSLPQNSCATCNRLSLLFLNKVLFET